MLSNMTPKHNSGESSPEGQNTVLCSHRVKQLKKELEDLDARLAKTNTINFEDIKTSTMIRNDNFSASVGYFSKVPAQLGSLDYADQNLLRQSQGLPTDNYNGGEA